MPVDVTAQVHVAPGGGTTVSNHVRGGGPRLFNALVRRNVQRDLERLREVLVSRHPTLDSERAPE